LWSHYPSQPSAQHWSIAWPLYDLNNGLPPWMAYLARTRSVAHQVEAYRRLLQHLDNYRRIPVLPFDEAAAVAFQQLRRARLRIGTMDLKIAAIAVSRDATLLSRNLADFRQVPGLQVEDWTA
jgi:tRNA(fMet)-specific endonuclease VapC